MTAGPRKTQHLISSPKHEYPCRQRKAKKHQHMSQFLCRIIMGDENLCANGFQSNLNLSALRNADE
jgi:hypothetical protein